MSEPSMPSSAAVREEMRRVLSSDERLAYRGITMSAMTGTKFQQLYGISTAEELIIAELHGAERVPSDDPTMIYLFSAGRGLTASYNMDYIKATVEEQGPLHVWDKTSGELHTQYRDMGLPTGADERDEIEGTLEAVAVDFVSWWTTLCGAAVDRPHANVASSGQNNTRT